jgi:DNA-binding CsgD family transcriptional regulator
MKTKSTVLTREERDVLILAAIHPPSKQLSNGEIAQRLGISVNKVKTLIHQACVKLEAHNRNEAILLAIRQGEIILKEFYSLDELVELLSPLGPDMLRRIAHLVRQSPGYYIQQSNYKNIPHTAKEQDNILTEGERDALILVGHGLTNKEIAEWLCISASTVRNRLSQACSKLGATSRGDAVMLALKQRALSINLDFTIDDIFRFLAPMGSDTLEKIAQLITQNLNISQSEQPQNEVLPRS